MENYSVPEGYILDDASGKYYSVVDALNEQGEMVQVITWFDSQTGEYTQMIYPVKAYTGIENELKTDTGNKNRMFLYALIAVIVVAAIGIGVWLCWPKDGGSPTNQLSVSQAQPKSSQAAVVSSQAVQSSSSNNSNTASKTNSTSGAEIEPGNCPYIGKTFVTDDGQYTIRILGDKKCEVNGQVYKSVEDTPAKSDTDYSAIRIINGADRMNLNIDNGGKTAEFKPTQEVGTQYIKAKLLQ